MDRQKALVNWLKQCQNTKKAEPESENFFLKFFPIGRVRVGKSASHI